MPFLVALISHCLPQIMLDYVQNTEANWDVRFATSSSRWECIMRDRAGLYTKYIDIGEASDHVEYEASLLFICLLPTHVHTHLHPQHTGARGQWPISGMDGNTSMRIHMLYINVQRLDAYRTIWRLHNHNKNTHTHKQTQAQVRESRWWRNWQASFHWAQTIREAFLYHIAKGCTHTHTHTHASHWFLSPLQSSIILSPHRHCRQWEVEWEKVKLICGHVLCYCINKKFPMNMTIT